MLQKQTTRNKNLCNFGDQELKTQDLNHLLELMSKAALQAGEAILEIYNQPINPSYKSDGTPVTIADQRSEEIILDILETTGIPVLAEESAEAGKIPKLGSRFFVVDPLDGTKEFIKKNGEFTVNIALVENGMPICGIVTAPALKYGFLGSRANGANEANGANGANGAFEFAIMDNKQTNIKPLQVLSNGPLCIVSSRSHAKALPVNLQEFFDNCQEKPIGSSLKFCLIANGKARIYPRFSPTCEWDTAAGQAVLEAAGGVVLALDGKPLSYGKSKSSFINPFFIAADCKNLAQEVLQNIHQK